MKKKVLRERRANEGITLINEGITFTVDEPTDEAIKELAKREEERIKKAVKKRNDIFTEAVKKINKKASKKKEA